ncbi:MAG: diacylglycerol kinase [Saccharospirillum sp.]
MTATHKPKARGIRRIINASRYSHQGLVSALTHEAAFRQEVALLVIGLPLAFWLSDTLSQAALLIASLLLVLVVELLNSAIEALVDRVSTRNHELSGRAKDMGSAAVMLTLLLAATLWGAAAWQKWALVGG